MQWKGFAAHIRQFILSREAYQLIDSWTTIELPGGWILSHCPDTEINLIEDAQGARWCLIGLAIQTAGGRPAPEKEVSRANTEDVPKLYRDWTGRWLLIGNNQIHLDACGLLGCYFYIRGDGTPVISSSLTLLSKAMLLGSPESNLHILCRGAGIDYDPPPLIGDAGVKKLLPSQILTLDSGAISARAISAIPDKVQSYETVLQKVGDQLVTGLRNLHNNGHELCLALTAGNDSRVLLAAAMNAGIPFTAFTQTSKELFRRDRKVITDLADTAGIEHQFIDPLVSDRKLMNLYNEHSGLRAVDADRGFFMHGQWNWCSSNQVVLRGQVFEAARCYYWSKFGPEIMSAEQILAVSGADGTPQYVQESISEYLQWIRRHPAKGVDRRDRFYLEMRIGGLVSTTEHALDLLPGNSINPANSSNILNLLWQIPADMRRRNGHHRDLANHLAPSLADIPINPPPTLIGKTGRRIRKYSRIIRNGGVIAALQEYKGVLKRRSLVQQ